MQSAGGLSTPLFDARSSRSPQSSAPSPFLSPGPSPRSGYETTKEIAEIQAEISQIRSAWHMRDGRSGRDRADSFTSAGWYLEAPSRQDTGSTVATEADYSRLSPASPDTCGPGRPRNGSGFYANLGALHEQRGWKHHVQRWLSWPPAVFVAGIAVGLMLMHCSQLFEAPRLPQPGQQQGWWNTIVIQDRQVLVYYPAAAQTLKLRELPVVFALHGSEDYAAPFARVTDFASVSERSAQPFIVAVPEMAVLGADSWGYKDDHSFFRETVDSLVWKYWAKRDEVYVCGHSNGGTMSIYLQNNLPDVFSGAGAVEAGAGLARNGAGAVEAYDNASFGSPTIVVWNHNDPVLNEYGGEQLFNQTLEKLRRHDTTATRPSFKVTIPTNKSTVRFAEQLMWGAVGSTPPTAIVSWESVWPTHGWAKNTTIPGAFDASTLVWDFFRTTRIFQKSQPGSILRR